MNLFTNHGNGQWRAVAAEPKSTADLERAIRARLAQLWDSGTQRSRAETAGFLLAEIDPILQRWIDEEK